MTHYGMHDGVPIGNPKPAGLQMLGVDKGGNIWGFVEQRRDEALVRQLQNLTSVSQSFTYSIETGSRLGFEQSMGVSITASAGFDVKFVSASLSTTISGSVSFAQAFHATQKHTLAIDVPPNRSVTICEVQIMVKYYHLYPVLMPAVKNGRPVLSHGHAVLEPASYFWIPGSNDVIETGLFAAKEAALARVAPLSAVA